MALSEDLLRMLACPQCKKGIELDEKNNRLICAACGLGFRINDDIPVLLVDEAEKL
jgi:uncharacterized protein YbaR (Trm112 family)